MLGQVVGGKYRIIEPIGEGGMGAVYAAEVLDSGETVAVKVLHEKYDDERSMERFDREARVGAAIDSPHVVRVFDTGKTDEGRAYMAMELLRGEELAAILARSQRLSPVAVCKLAVQALRGLHAAHEAGVIHRDIKPANVFVAYDDDGGATVKVLDFGIAKFRPTGEISGVTKGLTQTGALMGSPLYMSPEQAKGLRNIDRRSDLWSLGIVLYAALTGECPHDTIDTLGQLIISICSVPPEPVQEAAPWVPPAVADFVEQALQINVSERYPTAEAMLSDVVCIPGATDPLSRSELDTVPDADCQVVAPPSRVSRKRQGLGGEAPFSESSGAITVVDSVRPGANESAMGSPTPSGPVSQQVVPVHGTSNALLAATGLAVAVAIGLGIKLFGGGEQAPARPVATVTATAATTADKPMPSATSEATTSGAKTAASAKDANGPKVTLRLVVKPVAADVYMGDKLLGSSAGAIELPRSNQEVALRLVKTGYRDKVVKVVPDKEQTATVLLSPTARPNAAVKSPQPVPKAAPTKRPSGDLERPW